MSAVDVIVADVVYCHILRYIFLRELNITTNVKLECNYTKSFYNSFFYVSRVTNARAVLLRSRHLVS